MSKAGMHQIDITPPLGVEFIGYHRPNGIRSIEEQIYATALVLEHEETKTVVISIDNIGMLIEDTTVIRGRVAHELAISISDVMIVFSHTHSGPATASSNPSVEAYKNELINRSVKAAIQANSQLVPVKVGWGITEGEIGVNRREMTAEGNVTMGTDRNGVVDRRIGLLALQNQTTSALHGLILFCTAHPNVLKGDSEVLSADYPGRTRERLQQELNCPVIVIQGAAGNVNAKFRGSMEALQEMAEALSGKALDLLPEIQFKPVETLSLTSAIHHMKLKQIPEPDGIEAMALLAAKEWGVNTAKWQEKLLALHAAGIRNLTIDLEIQLLKVNEGSFAGVPMEPFAEAAIEVKEKLNNELAFFGGYTNGYLGYLPTKAAYPYGGYEVELNPVVYGPITNLWMPPEENTSEQVIQKILELHNT